MSSTYLAKTITVIWDSKWVLTMHHGDNECITERSIRKQQEIRLILLRLKLKLLSHLLHQKVDQEPDATVTKCSTG